MQGSPRRSRVRGLAPWRPQARTQPWVDAITEVLEADRPHWPLSARYVGYRLIGRTIGGQVVAKGGRAYFDGVAEKLNRGRRAGMWPWEAIADEGVTEAWAPGWSSARTFWCSVRDDAEGYSLDLLADQPYSVEVWCEAAGMVQRVAATAHRFGVPVLSGGGFDSVSRKYEAAQRILVEQKSRPVVVLHLGDLDDHGRFIYEAVAEDVGQFVVDEGGERPEIRRLAVTPEQVQRFGLPCDEEGRTQAEALPAAALDALLVEALDELTDADVRQAVIRRGERERQEVLDRLDRLASEGER